jgi:hypothetical protein
MFPELLLLSGLADVAGTTFSLVYDAAPDCPTEATFEAAILARTPGARKVATAADVHFEVTLGAERRLRVVLADGTVSEREIADDGCTESMQSMAVIAAMVLDAQKREAPAASPAPAPPPVPTSALPPPSAPAAPREAQPVRTRPNASSTWLSVVAGAVAEGAAAPTPAFGAALGVELGARRLGVVSPSVRVSGVFAQAKVVETDAGDARFRIVLARALLCGLRLGDEQRSLRLCGVVDGGALLGRGLNARNERGQTMPWLGVGLALVGTVRLAGPLSLEVGGGARGLVVHDEFIFAPGQPVYQVPVFAWNSWVGLSVRAW